MTSIMMNGTAKLVVFGAPPRMVTVSSRIILQGGFRGDKDH